MSYPRLQIDTEKIKYNTIKMVGECNKRGIEVAGVTKVFCGNQQIAKALVDGGVKILADSRVENLKKLVEFNVPKMMIRIPMLSQVKDIIKYADISLVSELVIIKELAKEALIQNKKHKIILMIDLGDLREGIFDEEDIYDTVKEIISLKGIELSGLGTNLSCYGCVLPSKVNLSRLVEIREKIQKKFQINIDILSGGNSGTISLFQNDDGLPKEINQLRLGASLTLGIGLNDEPIQGLLLDAFKLLIEVVEVKYKPSVPIGKTGLDSFGKKPVFVDKGIRKRAIAAIGKQDISPDNMFSLDNDITILGGSSDHIILDITESKTDYKVGDKIAFGVTYGGCLSTMTSEYVFKDIK